MSQENKSAVSAALAIPEILENVLRYLSSRDILRVQRTSQFFAAVIHGSKVIQEDLFLLPRRTHRPRRINHLIFDQKSGPKHIPAPQARHGPLRLTVRLTDELLLLDDQATVLNMLIVQPAEVGVTARATSVKGHNPGVCRITNPHGVTLRDVRCQYSWWSDRAIRPENVWLNLPEDKSEGNR
jgi:hypothetical protein